MCSFGHPSRSLLSARSIAPDAQRCNHRQKGWRGVLIIRPLLNGHNHCSFRTKVLKINLDTFSIYFTFNWNYCDLNYAMLPVNCSFKYSFFSVDLLWKAGILPCGRQASPQEFKPLNNGGGRLSRSRSGVGDARPAAIFTAALSSNAGTVHLSSVSFYALGVWGRRTRRKGV